MDVIYISKSEKIRFMDDNFLFSTWLQNKVYLSISETLVVKTYLFDWSLSETLVVKTYLFDWSLDRILA